MSRRARVTPELIRRVKEIKEERPALSYRKIAKLLELSRKSVKISGTTVGRILRDEYTVKDGKVVQVSKPKKIPLLPAPLAAVKQFQKVLEATIHEAAEMSRENEVRIAMTNLRNDLLETDMEFERLAKEAKNELDVMEEKFCKSLKFIKEGGSK